MPSISEQPNVVMDIHQKIQRARELFSLFGPALMEDARIRRLMEALDARIQASWKAMIEFKIVEACKRCEEEEGGSCCGAGIEDRYEPYLLLANLLAGADLPGERRQQNGCFFLGEAGCRLKIRDTLCINYLCTGIQKMLSHEDLVRLQNITGEEMDTVFLLHEQIITCLRQADGASHGR